MDHLTGKIGLVSDAHGNVVALAKAVRLLRRYGAERIYCLGDSVGYIPGGATLGFLEAEGIPSLKGNHEAMLLSEQQHAPRREAIYRLAETRTALDRATLGRLRGLPSEFKFATAAGIVLMLHASPDDPLDGYVYPDTPLETLRRQDFDIAFMGHTHRPFVRSQPGRWFVNVGSCGQPRDHGGFGSACLFDTDSGAVEIIRFDIRPETQAAITAAGLEASYVADVLARRSSSTLIGVLVDD